jgi:hypothetical protein
VFFDNPANKEQPQLVTKIDFTPDSPEGQALFDLLKKANYSDEAMLAYYSKKMESSIWMTAVIREKSVDGRNRYWNAVYSSLGKQYVVSSQWFSHQRASLEKWLSGKGI